MKKFFSALAVAAVCISCTKDADKGGEFKGAHVSLHHGKAWSAIRMNSEGVPQQLSITIDEAALNSVPTSVEGGNGGHHHTHANSVTVPLHQKAAGATPFRHIGLDWNPIGHEPANIYTVGHFDVHFYMVSEAERLAATDPAKLVASPPAAYLPPHHMAGAPVPQMGQHWVDITSPELNPANPAPFTQTFIFGTYDSKVTFYEPMITLDFMKNTTSFERSIPQPQKVQQTGYYPTRLKVKKVSGGTEVVLDGFVYRQAS